MCRRYLSLSLATADLEMSFCMPLMVAGISICPPSDKIEDRHDSKPYRLCRKEKGKRRGKSARLLKPRGVNGMVSQLCHNILWGKFELSRDLNWLDWEFLQSHNLAQPPQARK